MKNKKKNLITLLILVATVVFLYFWTMYKANIFGV